ncbi:MAG: NAD(P)/FAD-dependent oxidoreductase [Cyanophyceae cyanobacterium]
MKELLYREVPTPDIDAVCGWLQADFQPSMGTKVATGSGFRWYGAGESGADSATAALVGFVWTVQRTTYLKVFQWNEAAGGQKILAELEEGLSDRFPPTYPEPPEIDLSQHSIFEALESHYPETVKYFQKMERGEYDLTRVYWWERRWREGVRSPQNPKTIVTRSPGNLPETGDASAFDLIYVGGALGVVHAAAMAQLGYRVLLLERMPFGRMNREWNISRAEFQSLIDLGLFTAEEFESIISCEYEDGFHKFFDANNPPQARAKVLHTPTVLNVAIAADRFIQLCGEKLTAAGGEIWDETEFQRSEIFDDGTLVTATHLPTGQGRRATGRVLIDAMGTASPIAWQLNQGRPFDSVCPTVGAVINSGFEPQVWDATYGDVLFSHGDISRGRQLIWELFPAENGALTIYLFHYHQVNEKNPGSLLEMYEDFFTILPEYRRCDMDALDWGKATFGYIPGYFSLGESDRTVAFDRLIALGDAASLQSPLVFTGFGSMVRNLSRLVDQLDTALRHDLVSAEQLGQIRAYQSNIAVTWMFSKGMMVPTDRQLPPQRVNAMLNTFFGLLAETDPEIADDFIKDRAQWSMFNRLALRAAWQNPLMLWWILDSAGPADMLRWVGSYLNFTWVTFLGWLFGWLPAFSQRVQSWLEPKSPQVWFWLLTRGYALTDGLGRPQPVKPLKVRSQSNISKGKGGDRALEQSIR